MKKPDLVGLLTAEMREFMLREKRMLILPHYKETSQSSEKAVAGLLLEIAQFGFTLDAEATHVLRQLSSQRLKAVRATLTADLSALVGANTCYRPLFRNFPQDVPDDRSYLHQRLLGYLENEFGFTDKTCRVLACGHAINPARFDLDAFGACPICQRGDASLPNDKPNGVPLSELTPLRLLTIGTFSDVLATFAQLAESRTSLSTAQVAFVTTVLEHFGREAWATLPEALPFRENAALLVALALKQQLATVETLAFRLHTVTDVLRVAVALSGGDLSLKTACRFKLSNPLRRAVMGLLEYVGQQEENALEDMLRYRHRWLRLGEVLHIGAYGKRYARAHHYFDVMRNTPHAVETFNSQVEHLASQPSLTQAHTAALLALLDTRPGELGRRLDALLRKSKDTEAVIKSAAGVMGKFSTPMLLTLLKHFQHRRAPAAFRAFMPKGSVANLHFEEGDGRPALRKNTCLAVEYMARTELERRFRTRPALGRVYVDPALKQILVPFSQRSANAALVNLPRGSRLPYDTAKGFLRLFVHWVENSESHRIDVDLTCAMYDAQWNKQAHVSWTNLSGYGRSRHSGDIQSAPAPDGASEFIDLDLAACRSRGVRYMAVVVYSFTGQAFSTFEAHAGFMERDQPGMGKHFEPSTVANRFRLANAQTAAIPLVVDLETQAVIWADLGLPGNYNHGMIETSSSQVAQKLRAIDALADSRMSLHELFTLHARARGILARKPEHADLVLDLGMLARLEEVMADWL